MGLIVSITVTLKMFVLYRAKCPVVMGLVSRLSRESRSSLTRLRTGLCPDLDTCLTVHLSSILQFESLEVRRVEMDCAIGVRRTIQHAEVYSSTRRAS